MFPNFAVGYLELNFLMKMLKSKTIDQIFYLMDNIKISIFELIYN